MSNTGATVNRKKIQPIDNEATNNSESLNNSTSELSDTTNNENATESTLTQSNGNFQISSKNLAIYASCLSMTISIVHKLLRMFSFGYLGLIIMLYVVAGILSFFALICTIKHAKTKDSCFTVDNYFCGISLVLLLLV